MGGLLDAFRNAHRLKVILYALLKILKMDLLTFGGERR